MRDSVRFVTALGFAAALSIAAWAQTLPLRPGLYETTTETALPGAAPVSPHTRNTCLTADDVKDLSKRLVANDRSHNCTVQSSKATGTGMTFTAECVLSDTMKMQYSGDVTILSPDSYRAVVTMKNTSGGGSMPMMRGSTMTTTGKRIGECPK